MYERHVVKMGLNVTSVALIGPIGGMPFICLTWIDLFLPIPRGRACNFPVVITARHECVPSFRMNMALSDSELSLQ